MLRWWKRGRSGLSAKPSDAPASPDRKTARFIHPDTRQGRSAEPAGPVIVCLVAGSGGRFDRRGNLRPGRWPGPQSVCDAALGSRRGDRRPRRPGPVVEAGGRLDTLLRRSLRLYLGSRDRPRKGRARPYAVAPSSRSRRRFRSKAARLANGVRRTVEGWRSLLTSDRSEPPPLRHGGNRRPILSGQPCRDAGLCSQRRGRRGARTAGHSAQGTRRRHCRQAERRLTEHRPRSPASRFRHQYARVRTRDAMRWRHFEKQSSCPKAFGKSGRSSWVEARQDGTGPATGEPWTVRLNPAAEATGSQGEQ